jgi:heat shock protein HslJ
VDGKSLQFEDMGQTKMYCEEYMEVERAFNNNIGRVSQYSFEDDKVLLKDEEGNTLLELKKKQQ